MKCSLFSLFICCQSALAARNQNTSTVAQIAELKFTEFTVTSDAERLKLHAFIYLQLILQLQSDHSLAVSLNLQLVDC